jgi:hypothetical protein
MAEGDGAIYNNFKEQVMESVFNLASGGHTLKVALVTGYTPNIDTHTVWADASANEESGSGYTAGGKTLTGQDVTQDNDNDLGKFDAADVTFTGLDVGTPSHAILYDDTPTSPADPLIAYWELGRASNGGDYTLQWNASGLITLT